MNLKHLMAIAVIVAAVPSVRHLNAFEPQNCQMCESVIIDGTQRHKFNGQPCPSVMLVACRDCNGGGDGGCHPTPVVGLCDTNPTGHPGCGLTWEDLAAVEAAAAAGDVEALAGLIAENSGSVQLAAEGYAVVLDCQGRVAQATRIAIAEPAREEAA